MHSLVSTEWGKRRKRRTCWWCSEWSLHGNEGNYLINAAANWCCNFVDPRCNIWDLYYACTVAQWHRNWCHLPPWFSPQCSAVQTHASRWLFRLQSSAWWTWWLITCCWNNCCTHWGWRGQKSLFTKTVWSLRTTEVLRASCPRVLLLQSEGLIYNRDAVALWNHGRYSYGLEMKIKVWRRWMFVRNNEDVFDYICDCGYGYNEINDRIESLLQFIDL